MKYRFLRISRIFWNSNNHDYQKFSDLILSLFEKTKIHNSEKQNYEITTRLILSMEIPITITIMKSQH